MGVCVLGLVGGKALKDKGLQRERKENDRSGCN